MTESSERKILVLGLAAYAASTMVSMAVMSIGAGLLLLSLIVTLKGDLMRELRATASSPWMKRYLMVSCGLVAACALSLIVATLAPIGWGDEQVHPRFWDLAKVWYFVWPLVLVVALKQVGEAGRKTVLHAWLGALAVVSAIGVIQHFTGWPRPQVIPGNEGRFHATMFLGHHLSVASILIFPFFAALDKKKWGIALLGFAALFLSYSRMLWIALPVGILLWSLRALPRRQALGAVAVMMFGLAAASQVPQIRHRVMDAIGTTDRWRLWSANLELVKERPLTGVGFRRNDEASSIFMRHQAPGQWVFTGHAHNNVLDVLASMGAVGIVTWLAWSVFVFMVLRQVLKRPSGDRTFAWGLVCAWVVFQLNGLTQVNFWEGKVMHQMMWAMAWALFWVDSEVSDVEQA